MLQGQKKDCALHGKQVTANRLYNKPLLANLVKAYPYWLGTFVVPYSARPHTKAHTIMTTTVAPPAQAQAQLAGLAELRARQRAFFTSGATQPYAFRRQALDKLLDAIVRYDSRLVAALRTDLGKSEFEAYTTEIGFLKAELKEARRHLRTWMRSRISLSPVTLLPAYGKVTPKPYGMCLVIAPWNYPLQLALGPVVAAVAAGNCVVLKPSELAPATAQVMAELVAETFDPAHVALVQGGVPETTALLAEPWDHIFFTGSTQVGRVVARAAAEHLTPNVLELGGKSPCIVTADVPLQEAARRIVFGKFTNAGQTCVAPDYLLVDKRIANDFVRTLGETIQEQFGANLLDSPDLGRIVNERHYRRLTSYLDHGQIVFGGQTDETRLKIAPTILLEPALDSPLMQDEIFGPILPMMTYDTLDEAIRFVNSRAHPLALYIFSADGKAQETVLERCTYGGAAVNDSIIHLADPSLPFGGVGESGMGSYHGKHGFDVFSRKVGVLHKVGFFDLPLRFAPFTANKVKWIRRLV